MTNSEKEQLNKYKKANTKARANILKRLGFKTQDDYYQRVGALSSIPSNPKSPDIESLTQENLVLKARIKELEKSLVYASLELQK